MKVFNTNGNPIIAIFNKKLSIGTLHPAANGLFRRMAGVMLPLVRAIGKPAIQLFDSQPFEYDGRRFGLDATWVFPDGAIDGVHASFMVEERGRGFQFILLDHQRGTVTDRWFETPWHFAAVRACVERAIRYCHFRQP